MKNDNHWELILKYLQGECSAEDEKNFHEWLQTDIENRQTFDLAKQIWASPPPRLPRPDIEKAWLIVKQKTNIEALPGGEILSFDSQGKKPTLVWKLLRVAAVFLLLISISYLFFQLTRPISMHKVLVENTKQENIRLTDGTQVILDAGSVFRYPNEFDSHTREVFLSGEGYFEVAADREKPFIVHANDAVITVVGTKFNVRAWRQNRSTVVAVAQGKVSLRPETVKQSEAEIVIAENQMSEMIENKFPSPPQNTDINAHLSWLRREMYFKSAPLREVLDQLERWYDLQILLTDESYAFNRVTIFIKDKPVEEILDLIALMNDFRYEQHGGKITFSPKE